MSWLTDNLLELCIAVSVCGNPTSSQIQLPPEDASAWEFKAPSPDPAPPPVVPNIIINAAPPPAPAPITIQMPDEPEPEPKPEPKLNPAIVANQKLLVLRRLAALENSLPQQTMTIEANTGQESLPSPAGLLASLPSKSRPLDFNSREQQKKYEAPALDSGLPVDNTRIITEDEPIPVVLENAVNSQIAGKLVLVVERDIFGSHGSNILIPKFSRIVCKFEEADHANSTRIGMNCNRILSADKRFEIFGLNANVGSPQGQSGVTGGVDKRFWEKYGTAFILAGISTAVRVATGSIKSNSNNQNVVTAAKQGAEELSKKLGEITAKVLEETVSLKPVIRIAQGSRMSLTLGNDWYIRNPAKISDNG